MVITERDLIGAWKLLRWEIVYSGGRPTNYPFGEDAHGLILYAENGWMTATMSRIDRTPFSSPSAPKASTQSKATAADEYLSYGGRWWIEGSNVIHDVSLSLNPVLIGTRQIRGVNLSGGQLELSAQEGDPAGSSSKLHRLLWQKPTEIS